jgi:hypothetical protein
MEKALGPKNPWLGPFIYAASILPFGAMNYVNTDTILTLWETLAIYGFVKYWVHRGIDARGENSSA